MINNIKKIATIWIMLLGIGFSSELVWHDMNDSKSIQKNWNEAKKYCLDLKFNKHNDWRLPTIRELQTLVDLKKYSPAIKDTVHQKVSFTTFYWSSTPLASNSLMAWHIFYKYGESYYGDKKEKYAVMCVRLP